MLIPPFDACFFADDAHFLRVHGAAVDRAGPHRANRAVVIFHQDKGVIFQRRAGGNKALTGAHQPFDIELRRHGFGDKQRMGGQIPKHIAGPGKLRCYSPAGGFCLQLDGLVMEAVGELHVNDADLAEQSIGNHLPRLLDHLIAGIAVGDADDFVLFFAQIHQLARLFGGKAEGLFADNVESRLQRRFGNGEMGIVRGGDRDDLDAVRALRLFAKQGLVVGVAALRRDAQLLAERASALGIDVKRAGQQGINIVTQRRTAVAVADLTGSPAADHAPTQGAG